MRIGTKTSLQSLIPAVHLAGSSFGATDSDAFQVPTTNPTATVVPRLQSREG